MQRISLNDVKLLGQSQCTMRSIVETEKALHGRSMGIGRCGLCQCEIPLNSFPFEIKIPGKIGYVCPRCIDRLRNAKNGK